MPEESSKSAAARHSQKLHLHTLNTLCQDLMGGHAVEYGSNGQLLSLEDGARSVLSWYWDNQSAWTKNLSAATVQSILSSLDTDAPNLPPAASASNVGERKLLTLVKLEAHRFAGIHAYGAENGGPDNFIFEPSKPITMFEGANGSGKTSLINAIIWCLTGEIIRPQRPPEKGDVEFEIDIYCDTGVSTHKIPPVTPMPRPGVYAPVSEDNVPVDTWVELTFRDQNGNIFPSIRRALTRTSRGKIQESVPNLAVLQIDPISIRIGTTMPAMLPFIQIGERSELGRAVAELTGLSSLIALSKHAEKVSDRISEDLKKTAHDQINQIDHLYTKMMSELVTKVSDYPALKHRALSFPNISAEKELEEKLDELKAHFERCKAESFANAASILGEGFDPDDQKQIKDLESKVSPAIAKVGEIKYLNSAKILANLSAIDDGDFEMAESLLQKVCEEAAKLADLAAAPEAAKRNKLYARIAEWMKEFNIEIESLLSCPVCFADLNGQSDPLTGEHIKDLIAEHIRKDSSLISQSLQGWVKVTMGVLATELPASLCNELGRDLPENPVALIRTALAEELLSMPVFGGVLASLKARMKILIDKNCAGFGKLEAAGRYRIPADFENLAADLQLSLHRVERAIEFARWRKSNKKTCAEIHKNIVGSFQQEGTREAINLSPDSPLLDRLYAIQTITQSAAPISECLSIVVELKRQVDLRRVEEKKLVQYAKAVEALRPIAELGDLAAQQITDLQDKLKRSTEKWRNSVYKNYYSNCGHHLADTKVAPEGQLSITVGSNGTVAPAQHVSNASALRASLLGFYLAFWAHIVKTRGGLSLILLDDPQELLDEQNEERLADALTDLACIKAQLIVTTHDQRFTVTASRAASASALMEHRSVHPVNLDRHTLRVPLALADIDKKRREFLSDEDDADRARDYVSECRVFIEARLSDLFDEPAYSSANLHPTLMDYVCQARSLKNQNPAHEFFGCAVFKKFCEDPALQVGAKCLSRLNTAHHHGKQNIMPSDVAEIKDDLERLIRLSEALNKEFRLYRRREPSKSNSVPASVTELIPANLPAFSVPIFLDLAASTSGTLTLGSQDVAQDVFSSNWFEGKALFYVRNDMFGFSAPAGSIAIVEMESETLSDQNLVIAKFRNRYLARRLLKDTVESTTVTLATVSTDPRVRPPSIVTRLDEVELFRVVGFLFSGAMPRDIPKKHDAVQIEGTDIANKIRTCHRIKDHSAEPLALTGQLVLGGKECLSEDLISSRDELFAVALDDGSSIFKRFGGLLPGQLNHICLFESIGGRGASTIASLKKTHGLGTEIRSIETVRRILGVIFEGN